MTSPRPQPGPGRAIPVLVVGALIGTAWLVLYIAEWVQRADVMGRGMPASAVVLDSGGGGRGSTEWVRVRFSTTDGDDVVAKVLNPPKDPPLRPGDRLDIRYDPRDPYEAVPVDGGQAVSEYLIYIVGGAAILGISVYGIWWWTRPGRRRPARTFPQPRRKRPAPPAIVRPRRTVRRRMH
ncbi:DUF3592 domain-containing protein [Dactylosporangium sp. NPDC051541]|uniref:DUF3592 domain-containing protein n=1 Tax=Dactylosporangium sp. NPDC051541 TaxID=3363977 RepID=UPI0037AC66B8